MIVHLVRDIAIYLVMAIPAGIGLGKTIWIMKGKSDD